MVFRRVFKLSLHVLASMFLVFFGAAATHAAELKQETVTAWNAYLQAEQARMNDRLHNQAAFLWIDAAPDRVRRVHAGQILVAPVGEHMPKRVPGGLVHHWTGASFIPDVRLTDVLTVVRSYDHYKEFYGPTVIASTMMAPAATLEKIAPDIIAPMAAPEEKSALAMPFPSAALPLQNKQDQFTIRFLNKAVLSKTAIDADYKASYLQLDPARCYGVAYTTRLQEIRNYGERGQAELPPNQGNGYIWELYTATRFVERDGGVYMEVDAIALSRDIPAAVRWAVDPVVRRVSRDALNTSLLQTRQAVGQAMFAKSRGGRPVPAEAIVAGTVPASTH